MIKIINDSEDAKGEVCGCAVNNEGELVVGATSGSALCNRDENYAYYLRGSSRLYGYDSKHLEFMMEQEV